MAVVATSKTASVPCQCLCALLTCCFHIDLQGPASKYVVEFVLSHAITRLLSSWAAHASRAWVVRSLS
jgi:hypothetical protein